MRPFPIMRLVLFCVLSGGFAPAAQACAPVKDTQARQRALLREVQAAPNEGAARQITNQLWEIWATAPDAIAQSILDAGLARRAEQNFEAAAKDFTQLIVYCPDYAEGYNQRAFIAFILGRYDAALADLDRALELSPLHVAAMAGRALTLMGQGREAEGRAALRRALELNPWLPERRMLRDPPKAQTDL